MRIGEVLAAGFWLAVALGVTWAGAGLGLGTLSDPGPGGMIFWVGVAMTALSLATLVVALRQAPSGGPWLGTRWWLVPYIVALLALYAWLLPAFGLPGDDDAAAARPVPDDRPAGLDRAAAHGGARHGGGLPGVPPLARHPAAGGGGGTLAHDVSAFDFWTELARGADRQSCDRVRRRAAADQSALLLRRRVHRHAGRRAAGHRAGGGHVAAAAGDVHRSAGGRHHHAGRHLLRLNVRRLHHRHPGQHPGRGGLGGHLARRPSDGAPGQGGAGARHRRHRLVHRRHVRDRRPDAGGAGARPLRRAASDRPSTSASWFSGSPCSPICRTDRC